MNGAEKLFVWLHGEIKTPPFSKNARIEAGTRLGPVDEAATRDRDLVCPRVWRT
jgi:hypothetical protein